jgi:hypothetical protein
VRRHGTARHPARGSVTPGAYRAGAVPIEVSPESLRIALARLGEHDLDAPGELERALEWIAVRDDPDGPLTIRRYDLQVFL